MAIFGGWRLTRTGILFVIGIIVLAGLVTGGVFLVKNRGEAARREEAVKIAEQNLEDQSKVAVQPAKAEETATEASSNQTTAVETAAAEAATTAEALPQTGPAELRALGRILIVTILALSASFYVASRRVAKNL